MASASNLFSALTNGSLVISAILAANSSAKRGWVFSPVPTAVPPWASCIKAVERLLDALDAVVDLRRIAAEFLPQSQGSGVLQMRAADLDDVLKGLGLILQRLVEPGQRRD